MNATVEVRAASEAERPTVIGIITLAFASDPMTRWTFPDAATYLAVMPQMAEAFGGNAFAHRSVDLIGGGGGAAMWLGPGVQPDLDRLMALTEQHARKDRRSEVLRIFEQMDALHPSQPCWYLPLIGVDPACQGHGLGSALLGYALERCDRDDLPAYLESSSSRNIPLYERHGFRIIGAIQEGSSPTIVPMLRLPRQR